MLTITDKIPTSLVHDFNEFTQYLINTDVLLTKTNQFLKRKHLVELNERMIMHQKEVSKSSDQPKYLFLNLLYHLGRYGQLFKIILAKQDSKLCIIESYNMYCELTDTEKYMFLLESFWTKVDWTKAKVGRNGEFPVWFVQDFLKKIASIDSGTIIHIEDVPGFLEWGPFIDYFSFFGLWNIVQVELDAKSVSRAEAIVPTEFGIALARVLSKHRNIKEWNIPYQKQYKFQESEFDLLSSIFRIKTSSKQDKRSKSYNVIEKAKEPFYKPFISLFKDGELKKSLYIKNKNLREKSFILKISVSKKIWCKIELSGRHTLLDLHNVIQDSFDFDDDHLYAFFMDGKPWSRECYNAPLDVTGPYVNEVIVGDLELYEGKKFLYIFDYGDQWEFEILVEKISDKDTELLYPTMIQKKGESPEQYPEYF